MIDRFPHRLPYPLATVPLIILSLVHNRNLLLIDYRPPPLSRLPYLPLSPVSDGPVDRLLFPSNTIGWSSVLTSCNQSISGHRLPYLWLIVFLRHLTIRKATLLLNVCELLLFNTQHELNRVCLYTLL